MLVVPQGQQGGWEGGRECITTRPSADWLIIFSADSVCIGDDTSTSAHLSEKQRQHSFAKDTFDQTLVMWHFAGKTPWRIFRSGQGAGARSSGRSQPAPLKPAEYTPQVALAASAGRECLTSTFSDALVPRSRFWEGGARQREPSFTLRRISLPGEFPAGRGEWDERNKTDCRSSKAGRREALLYLLCPDWWGQVRVSLETRICRAAIYPSFRARRKKKGRNSRGRLKRGWPFLPGQCSCWSWPLQVNDRETPLPPG